MAIGWSQRQAQIAIGAGGIFGQGIGQGSQTQYRFLPEPQTDFIFAAIAEELGLIGVSVLFFLFSILIWRIFKIALSAQTNFPRSFCFRICHPLNFPNFHPYRYEYRLITHHWHSFAFD